MSIRISIRLLDRLTIFGQMLERFERLLEVAHRFAVR